MDITCIVPAPQHITPKKLKQPSFMLSIPEQAIYRHKIVKFGRMNLMSLQTSKSIFLHVLFWVAVWFFYIYFFSYNSDNIEYVIWFSSLLLPITILTTYISTFYLIPRYLLKNKYWAFALNSIYLLIFSTYFIVLSILGSFILLSNLELQTMPPMSRNYIFVLILVYIVVLLVSSVSLLNHNLVTTSHNKELQNRILNNQLNLIKQELDSLKKQIHPHFLFNTLNTIYGFALKQSEETPMLILKLSNILDYILYQVNKPLVPLKAELNHLNEYIELEKTRFKDSLIVNYSSDSISNDLEIAPMLLIPFVENAFKHGSRPNGIISVTIRIKVNGHSLDFLITNPLDASTYIEPNTKGIGLYNIKKRLEILYPDSHTLDINQEDDQYTVHLTIDSINQPS